MLATIQTYFKLRERNSTVKTEIFAGITTFLTAVYIIFVNPAILSYTGMDKGAVFVATCLITALGTLIMGLYANYPVVVAPSMGLNAYFAYVAVQKMGLSWQVGLTAVFFSGILFLILSLLKVRQWIIDAIPYSIKVAIVAGIGLFLGLIGLEDAGIVTANPDTLVQLGNLKQATTLLCLGGFCVIAILDYLKIPGAIIIGILAASFTGILFGVNSYHGIVSMPPSLAPTFFAFELKPILTTSLIIAICTFFFVAFFDSTGTLIAVASSIGLIKKDGHIEGIYRALQTDSISTIAGAFLGTSTSGAYIESAAGIRAGGRTGLTAVVISLLFLASLFLAPLVNSIPSYASASALIFIACILLQGLANINWEDISESAPAVITVTLIPLTFSISDGISIGFISYVIINLLTGQLKKLNVMSYIIAAFCALYLVII